MSPDKWFCWIRILRQFHLSNVYCNSIFFFLFICHDISHTNTHTHVTLVFIFPVIFWFYLNKINDATLKESMDTIWEGPIHFSLNTINMDLIVVNKWYGNTIQFADPYLNNSIYSTWGCYFCIKFCFWS